MDLASSATTTTEQEVVIALGSNVGNRMNNFKEALRLMKHNGIRVTRHSCLYETEPVHVTDQPKFLNAAIRGVTKLDPHELLTVLKKIEKEMGRQDNGIRYGPRPLDLDILFYGKLRITSDKLIIPHERIWERPFVLAPLVDLLGSDVDDDNDHIVAHWHSLATHQGGIFQAWEKLGGESLLGKHGIQRVLPIGDQLWDFSTKTYVMGILNLTPDSFSDGGKFQSIDSAVSRVRAMIFEGVDIIDIGAQSTRPMASRISSQEELDRLTPVLKVLRGMQEMKGKLISVDTFNSEVALEAIRNGADILNDVSGGSLDPNMYKVVADSDVPYMVMHMRGDPCTMQNKENLEYTDVCKDVALELYSRVRDAELSGIPAWRIMTDPGIGFSKKTEDNLDIIMDLPKIRKEMAKKSVALSHAPMLIGPSRKRFLGDICGRPEASERDPATVACVTAGILGGASVIRVHNVRDNLDAARLCDAMMRREGQTIGKNKKLKTGNGGKKPEEEEEEAPVNNRDLTSDEKRRLVEELQDLPYDKRETVVQIIKKRNPELYQQDDEIEVDIDTADMETLWELYRFVTEYKESLGKKKEGFSSKRDVLQEQTTLATGSSSSSSDSSGSSSSSSSSG